MALSLRYCNWHDQYRYCIPGWSRSRSVRSRCKVSEQRWDDDPTLLSPILHCYTQLHTSTSKTTVASPIASIYRLHSFNVILQKIRPIHDFNYITPNFNSIGSGVSEPQVAENRCLPLTGGVALTTVYALTCYTVIKLLHIFSILNNR